MTPTLSICLIWYKEGLTQTPQCRLAWCKCQMSRAPHLLAAQLKKKKKQFCISTMYDSLIFVSLLFRAVQTLLIAMLFTCDFDFLHNLSGFVVDFYFDTDWISMVINLKIREFYFRYFTIIRIFMLCQIALMYLFFKGGLQVNWFVSHHKLLGNVNLGSGLVGGWGKLYFTNHQTASVPKTRRKRQKKSEG